MFPQFGSTAETLSKASALVFRIGTDAHLYDYPDDVSIGPLLDSRFDSEKTEALKRLLALIAQGLDVANFFPQVVKNVASQSLEVKKLVYLYLLHYAEKRPNEALLSINCFQKDLSDPNPLVRAWALRAMAGIRLHVIAPLVLAAVTKCSRDPSAYVRKCAANALPKLNDLHQDQTDTSLQELVSFLLNDHSPGVVGAAAAAFNSVCPDNLMLIGKSFRKLCEILPDVEEWGQIILIGILLRYVVARHGVVRESLMFSVGHSDDSPDEKDSSDSRVLPENEFNTRGMIMSPLFRSYIEGTDEYLSRSSHTSGQPDTFGSGIITSSENSDVKLLLQCTSPLLWSQNSAVVLAAAGVHWIMATKKDLARIVKPLLFLLRSSPASKFVVLCNIQVFVKEMPTLFASHFEEFFVCCSDSYQMRALKLEILSTISTDSSIPFIFHEFEDYIKDPDQRFVADTVAAIGLCAQRLPNVANACLEGLLALIVQESSEAGMSSAMREENVLTQAVMSVKAIIKQNPASYEQVIVRLARLLDSIKIPAARSTIIWIAGEYSSLGQIIPRIVPTLLKYLARCFTSEDLDSKCQILCVFAKVLLCAQSEHLFTFERLFAYVIELAKCDSSYDVRDRARFISKLLSFHLASGGQEEGNFDFTKKRDLSSEIAEKIFVGKAELKSLTRRTNCRFYLPGSLSHIVFHAAPGYEPLPKPCSLFYDDLQSPEFIKGKETRQDQKYSNCDSETNDLDTSSGSFNEASASSYASEHSIDSSIESNGAHSARDTYDSWINNPSPKGPDTESNHSRAPLIHISDILDDDSKAKEDAGENNSMSLVMELMSNNTLESWLDEQHSSSGLGSFQERDSHSSSVRISLRDPKVQIKPKIHKLLESANGNGLKVDYSYSLEISSISNFAVCVDIFFENCSLEPMSKIIVNDDESDGSPQYAKQALETSASSAHQDMPKMLPMEEISSLEPGQSAKRNLQVRFHHHLLPVKLSIFCDGKQYPVKLWPDIGYFIKPLPLVFDVFLSKESQLRGMFEYTRRFTFVDHIVDLNDDNDHGSHSEDRFLMLCHSLASKMLSNANVFLVSVDMPVANSIDDATGLCLRFSSEILSSLTSCLITFTVEGKCLEPLNITVKVNCEETVFGLNLLNRIVTFMSSPPSRQDS